MTANYQVRGFLFLNRKRYFTDMEDYGDFMTKEWTKEELINDLSHAVLPTGMILCKTGSIPMVVMQNGLGLQHLVALERLI